MIITKINVQIQEDQSFSIEIEGLDNSGLIRSYKGTAQAFEITGRKATSEEVELADDMEEIWHKHRKTRRQRFMEILDQRDGLI